MRNVMLSLLLAGLFAGCAAAQSDPYLTYNQMRAYRQFLNSPYSYRTYSGSSPGYTTGDYTPYGYESYARGPVYQEQRITPRGYEAYRSPVGERYTFVPYPQPAFAAPPPPQAPERLNPPLDPDAPQPGDRFMSGGRAAPIP